MNRLVRKLTSLSNLRRATSTSGQMATLLILLMVLGLSFVLFTANVGNMSVQSTALSNAADSSALMLSSNLSTKARQLFEGLGNREKKCYKTGGLSMVLAIVIAIIAIIFTCGAAAPAAVGLISAIQATSTLVVMAAGAVGGAIGGAIGGSIAGTGAGQGALQGAIIGAAIGGLASGAAGMMQGGQGTAAVSGGQTMTVPAQGAVAGIEGSGSAALSGSGIATSSGTMGMGAQGGLAAGTALPAGSTLAFGSMTFPAAAGLGTAIFQGVGVASQGYNMANRLRGLDDGIDQITAMFGKASEKDRLTQTTIMRAMSTVVDDPNVDVDVNDSNFNGDTTDNVSDYQVWWWKRAENIPEINANLIANAMNTLYALQAFIGGLLGGPTGWVMGTPDLFVSEEYMWEMDMTVPAAQLDILLPGRTPEGLMPDAFRAIEASGTDLSFWEPGPDPAAYTASLAAVSDADCVGAACDTEPPPGYDRFDMITASLREVYVWIYALSQQNPNDLASTWDDWIRNVYRIEEDPDEDPLFNPYTTPPASLHGILTLVIYELNSWTTEIKGLYSTWPMCVPSAAGYTNPPCRMDYGTWQDGSFDEDPTLEYGQLLSWMEVWGPQLLDFLRSALKAMAQGYAFGEAGMPGGKNPATYEWHDARGRHRVRVRLGDFRVPRIEKHKYGNWLKGKTCMELESHTDEWEYSRRGRDVNYVEVMRYDQPSGQAAIGRWNPLNRPLVKRAYYSYGRTWNDVHLRRQH